MINKIEYYTSEVGNELGHYGGTFSNPEALSGQKLEDAIIRSGKQRAGKGRTFVIYVDGRKLSTTDYDTVLCRLK